MRIRARHIAAIAVIVALVPVIRCALKRPSNDRDWKTEHAVLPEVTFNGGEAHVRGVRNFSYRTATDFTPAYYDTTYDLDGVASVWFGVSVFKTEWRGPAHSFLSFGFDDGSYVTASIEARQEKGENYSMIRGLFRSFEVIYVIGDERDVIGTRAIQRTDRVYLYPIRASRDRIRALLLDVLEGAQRLHDKPKFYNTLTDNCTTLLRDHANRIATRKIPGGYRVLLPGYADELLLEAGLIDTELDIEGVRKRFYINEKARRYADDPDFSRLIRESDG